MSEIEYQAKSVPISECFDYLSGNTGLSVRIIHASKGDEDCIVLSSSLLDSTSLGYIDSNTILPNGKKLKLFYNKEGIVVSRNGYAGTMSYLKPGMYTLTDHAYILYKKEDCKYDIDLNWFILSNQYEIQNEFLTTKEGNQTFSITQCFKKFKFDIPTIDFQKQIAEKYHAIEKEKNNLIIQRTKIENFCLEDIKGYNIKEVSLFELFEPHQGNAIFTKKNIHTKGWEGDIPVISSNTDNNGILDFVNRKFVKDKDYITVPCLTWSVDGYAGKLFARNIEKDSIGFVANNHCGVLFPLVDVKNLYFPYLIYCLQPEFFKRTKNSGNKKLGNNQMSDIMINMPIDKDGNYDLLAQMEIAKKYDTINKLKENLIKQIDKLINTHIIFK